MKPNNDETQEISYHKENWFDAKLLKSAGVIIGFMTPLFCWIVFSIFNINSEMAVQKEKLSLLSEVRMDLRLIRDDLNQVKIDVSIIKAQQKAPWMYNNFGLVPSDISNYLLCDLADFSATSSTSGGTYAVQKELDMAESLIVSYLSKHALDAFSSLNYVLIVPDISGNFVLPIEGTLERLYSIPEYSPTEMVDNQSLSCYNGECESNLISNLNLVTCISGPTSAGEYNISCYESSSDYYAIITPDILSLDVPDLKMILRDLVVCSLGSILFSKDESEWKAISRACDRSQQMLSNLLSYWPSTFKSLKFLINPVPSRNRIYSVRSLRS